MISSFNWADWAILAILGMSALISLIRGFVKEALSLTSWAVAFVVTMTFHANMVALLENLIEKEYVREIAAYVVLFAGTLAIGSLIIYLLGELVKRTGLSGTDRLLGMIFGVARGVIVVVALLVILPSMLTGIDKDEWWQESQLIPHFLVMSEWSQQTFGELSEWASTLVAEHRNSDSSKL